MDAKAKIEEMLRRKRAPEQAAPARPTPPAPPPVTTKVAQVKETTPAAAHGNALDRINALLRARQQPAVVNQPITEVPAANIPIASAPVVMASEQAATIAPTAPMPQAWAVRCPTCTGLIELQAGIFVCRACQRQFVKNVSGELINMIELPFGCCQCCLTRAPLVKTNSQQLPICAQSREPHIFAAGQYARVSSLPCGVCNCCDQPHALLVCADGVIRCPHSNTEYLRNIDGTIVRKPVAVDVSSVDEIESALTDGNAAFYYGGFLGGHEQEQEQQPRRRRRR
jgi:hypothetical protein